MKFLLVTTSWENNPGDVFIRIGIENLIRSVDPSAVFESLDKENPEEWSKAQDPGFDKIVWCGMPLFWSFPTHCSQDIYWWEGLLRPLMKNRKKDFAIMGAGTAGVVSSDPKLAFTRLNEVKDAFSECVAGCQLITTRDDCVSSLIPDVITFPIPEVLPCPAFFAAQGIAPIAHDMTCNIMPEGSHYPEIDPWGAARWQKVREFFAAVCRKSGAFFCPHSDKEFAYAVKHGWKDIAPFNETLSHLKGSKSHTGNRIHGAIIAASAGGRSICIGYDLRLRAAEICGCEIKNIGRWKYAFPKPVAVDASKVADRYRELIRGFIGA